MSTIKKTIKLSTKQLETVSDSARLDTELLLSFTLKKDRSFLHAWPDFELTEQQQKMFKQLFERRLKGEPVAHILGEREFWSLNLTVTSDTLIPRPDTERLVELALEIIPAEKDQDKKWNILDLGTGTGAIALSLAKERPASHIIATDKSKSALEIAKQNAKKNHLSNVEFIHSDWFAELANQKFNMIVSNPPYICENDPHLNQGDVSFEPLSALSSGKDGLDDIHKIINNSQHHLKKNGVLLLEHGYDQAEAVCNLLKAAGFQHVKDFKDYNNQPRIAVGYFI